jgi:hypothetical protein
MGDQFNQPTNMLTPQQYQQQQYARNNQDARLGYSKAQIELGAEPNPGVETKSKSQSKAIINGAAVLILIVGVVGSFIPQFDMTKFVLFIEKFAILFVPLVIAVGSGRAFKNWTEKRYHAQEGQTPINPNNQPPQ